MGTYKYTKAAQKAGAQKGADPKDELISLFQETLKDQFYNSSNWWTVQEETAVGSRTFEEIDVRISHVINAETGLKLGDDWKTVYFEDLPHKISLGRHYIFDDSTWLTVNTEIIKNLAATCTIRRCNNTLRWLDETTGAYYEEPCCIEYLVKEPRDYATQGSPFMTPGGFLHIVAQFNERTNLINENQRFLFGGVNHWTGYKVIGTGLNDFQNVNTYDNESSKVLVIDMAANFVDNQLDDIVNGIANVHKNIYTLSLDKVLASGSPGGMVKLAGTVTLNGATVDRNLEWASSNTIIATVNSGCVVLKATGSCIVTANIENNTISGSCAITVSGSPAINNSIMITPDKNYVLEGSTQTYAVYLYRNDVIQADTFTIVCNGNTVPSSSYSFLQTDGNHFSVLNNLRDLNSYLTIQATSGSNVKLFDIMLRGAW
jgi:hypothetical protein